MNSAEPGAGPSMSGSPIRRHKKRIFASVQVRSGLPMDERARAGSTDLGRRFSPPAVILDPVRPDLPGVDRGEFVGLAGAAEVGEEIGAVAELAGVEPGLQLPHDVAARVQALGVRPRPAVDLPRAARSLPLLVAIVQPAT